LPFTSDQDYFAVFGLDRRMTLDRADLEKCFYTLSRRLHPDNFYRASREEQESSLDQSARLNDAYRTLRDPIARAEYLLSLEGPPVEKKGSGIPPELLEEVFELNEWLAELRATDSAKEQNAHRAEVQQQLTRAKANLEQRLETSLAELQTLFTRWDQALAAGGSQPDRTAIIESLGRVLAKRKYLQTVVREISTVLEGSAAR
jgi:molecular chaperone HscB